MKGSELTKICSAAILAIGFTAFSAMADVPKKVVVNFGAGLNTLGEEGANERIIPRKIMVRKGGVVNFVVSGFHQVFVYKPGVGPEDFDENVGSGTFVDQNLDRTFYQGVSPEGDVSNPLSNAQNRVEAVFFGERGTYLVICNVREHFFDDKMFAFVKVLRK
jgi:hypothetical protein